jgi:uncharacterized phage-associated protein
MIRTDVERCLRDLSDLQAHGSASLGGRVFDVRAIANLVLDVADSRKIEVTNMALNKIVFFVHSDYLIENNRPLVGAKIEAWKHGPVFREIYHEFKRWDNEAILGRAQRVNPDSGELELATEDFEGEETYLRDLIHRYVDFSAAYLRAISHRSGGPWHKVWGHEGETNPGMQISNDIILEHYSGGVRQ